MRVTFKRRASCRGAAGHSGIQTDDAGRRLEQVLNAALQQEFKSSRSPPIERPLLFFSLNPPFSLLIINSSVTRMKLALSIPDSGGAIRLKGGRDRGCKELDGDVHSQPDRLTGRKQGREAEMGEMHACGRGGRGDGGGGGGRGGC